MEVTSRFIENGDLGRLHVTRFAPSGYKPDEIGVYFGGVNSRSTTLDTFGAAYVVADEMSVMVDVIDRPGNGSSTLPEDNALYEDFKRFGFIALCDAIIDAQIQDDDQYKQATKIHAGGMSIGARPAVNYLMHSPERAASATLLDSGSLRLKAPKSVGIGRYFAYLAVEQAANFAKRKPKIDDLYTREQDIHTAYQNFKDSNPMLPVNPVMSKAAKKFEFNELCRATEGTGIGELLSVMSKAVASQQPLEIRSSRSKARVITDPLSVAVINLALDTFDKQNPEQTVVSYGFLQACNFWWHDLAVDPNTIRALIRTPISQLQSRLR